MAILGEARTQYAEETGAGVNSQHANWVEESFFAGIRPSPTLQFPSSLNRLSVPTIPVFLFIPGRLATYTKSATEEPGHFSADDREDLRNATET